MKNHNKKYISKDYFARIIATLSLIVAIGSVLIPYYQEAKKSKELLVGGLHPTYSENIRLSNEFINNCGQKVYVPWKLLISNAGFIRVSIIDYNAFRTVFEGDNCSYDHRGGIFYSDGNQATFPIHIEPGETKVLIIYLGILTPQKAYSVLDSVFSTANIPYEKADFELALQGLDLWGNKVTLIETADGYGGRQTIGVKRASFFLELMTGRGSSFFIYQKGYPLTNK